MLSLQETLEHTYFNFPFFIFRYIRFLHFLQTGEGINLRAGQKTAGLLICSSEYSGRLRTISKDDVNFDSSNTSFSPTVIIVLKKSLSEINYMYQKVFVIHIKSAQ